MEQKTVTIPFDLEMAKKINIVEVFKKGIMVKLKYVEKRVLDTFTDNGVDLSNYTHCIIVKRNFYLAW